MTNVDKKSHAIANPGGMIVIGYQRIGKSTLANDPSHEGIIDLESSMFKINGQRDDNWARIYCRIAVSLAKQGNVVFISSHKEVRKELALFTYVCPIVTITPALYLEGEWIDRLRKRYENNPSEKNSAAYENAKACYEDNIIDIRANSLFDHIELRDINYLLEDVVDGLIEIYYPELHRLML